MMFWEAIPLLALGGPLFIAGLLCGSFVQIEDRGLLRNSTSIHSSQGHERHRSIGCFVLYPSILATCLMITTVLVRLIPVVSAKAQDQSLHAAVSGQQDPPSPLDARRKNSWGPFLRQPRQNRTAPIWRLPPELILMIADNLCPSDTAAFCLASKRILGVIGERAFELSGNELYKFLSRLQSGMPNHILCYQCAKFHHKFLVEQSWHLECERRNRCMETAFGQFPFTDAQQVMNYHFYGTRHWLFPGITVYYEDDSPDNDFRGWELVDLRISGEDLLLRQQIARVPPSTTLSAYVYIWIAGRSSNFHGAKEYFSNALCAKRKSVLVGTLWIRNMNGSTLPYGVCSAPAVILRSVNGDCSLAVVVGRGSLYSSLEGQPLYGNGSQTVLDSQ
ncbi:uncharacterized protein CIMG_07866 [Coccidioides immitis RS]|uniref:F-box domain-containing protein n=4 Tax=Coccidioides immitis TaxID=5501 RepID=J3K4A7_COCIM|nr:uncharacterized protein CIMG_07866 [Coccidioides immitis RS]EAS29120.3 hypothetical protein CIMG_07866 [Coccidioides immitis RS]